MSTLSLNNVILLEPYTGKRKIEATVSKGLATVKQKGAVIGLKVLADARVSDLLTIKKGSVAYINEDYLYNNQGILKPMESEGIEGSFIVFSIGSILFFKEE